MADHSRIAVDQRKSEPQADKMPGQTTANLETPEVLIDMEQLRAEYRNFQIQNANLGNVTGITPVNLNPEINTVFQRDPLRDLYYVNPARNYDLNFENKILQYERAAQNLANIYEEKTSFALFSNLRGMNKEEIAVLKEISKEQFQREFEPSVKELFKLDVNQTARLETLLKGDKVESYASEINERLLSPEKSKKELTEIIKELDPKSFEEVKEALQSKYQKELPKEFEPREIKIEEIKDLLIKAEKEPQKLMEYLRELPKDDLKLIPEAISRIEKQLPLEIKEIAKAFSEDNRPLAEALYMRKEIQENTFSGYKATQIFENLTKEEKSAFTEIYKEKFEKNPYYEIKNVLSDKPEELKIIKQAVENPRIDDSAKIYLLSLEAEKSKPQAQALVKILEEKSYNEITQIKQEIFRTLNTTLDNQLTEVLKGKEQFMGRLSLYGTPDTLEDEYNRRKAIHDFERLNRLKIPESVLPDLAAKGTEADKKIEEIKKQHKNIEEVKEALTEEDEIKFYSLLNIFDTGIKNYAHTKARYYRLLAHIISAISSFITYLMAHSAGSSPILSLTATGATYLLALHITKSYFKKSESTEKALANFKDRQRKRGKSHKSRKRLKS